MPALFSWSSGKDSALALFEILTSRQVEVAALLTTITEDYDRISMHGVRRALLEQQAAALGLPLEKVVLTKNASNEEYEAQMRQVLARYQALGIDSVIFGDLYLEDIRSYREKNLAQVGMKAIFPLWKRDTRELAQTLLRLGFKAVTTCVDTQALGAEFVGRDVDAQFLAELPAAVDPCGENGEYHSFAYDGPIFASKISFELGERVLRENRFYFCDLIPTTRSTTWTSTETKSSA